MRTKKLSFLLGTSVAASLILAGFSVSSHAEISSGEQNLASENRALNSADLSTISPEVKSAETEKSVEKVAPNPISSTRNHDHASHKSSRDAKNSAAKNANEKWLDALWHEADSAFHDGDYPRAIVKFRAITAIDPTDSDAFGTGAWLMWSLGNGDEATAFMRRALAGDAQNYEMWEEAGKHFALRKIFPLEVQQFFARALQLAPKNIDTRILRHRLAHAAENNGEFATARSVWEETARKYADDTVATRKVREFEAQNAQS